MPTFVFDAYENWTVPQLKERCRELVRAVSHLQDVVAVVGHLLPDINAVPESLRQEVWNRMYALSDDAVPPLPDPNGDIKSP